MQRRTAGVIVSAIAAVGLVGYGAADVAGVVPGLLSPSAARFAAPAPNFPHLPLTPGADATSPEGTPVDSNTVALMWQPAQAEAAANEWTAWAMVADLHTGEILLNDTGDVAHTPASTVKLLTTFTALSLLDPADTLTTSASLSEATVHLSSEGDMLLGEGKSNPYVVAGRGGIDDLAGQVAVALNDAGLQSVSISWDANPFEGAARLAELADQDAMDYVGPVASMGIAGGRIDADDDTGFYEDPARRVAIVFAEALEARGIATSLGGPSPQPEGAQILASVESASIGEQLRWMLHNSDNTVAEQYCRLAAAAAGASTSFAGSTALVRDTLDSAGISVAGLYLEDCSGLSLNNRLSARTLVDTLSHAASAQGAVANVPRFLPWAGLSGTVRHRMEEGAAFVNAQAKTGSLPTAATLTGIVQTAGGRILIFAVGTDGVTESDAVTTRPVLDDFVSALAGL